MRSALALFVPGCATASVIAQAVLAAPDSQRSPRRACLAVLYPGVPDVRSPEPDLRTAR